MTVDNRRPSFFISVALKMPASGWKTASAMRTSGAQTSTYLKSLEIKSVTLRRVRHCLLHALASLELTEVSGSVAQRVIVSNSSAFMRLASYLFVRVIKIPSQMTGFIYFWGL